MHIKYWPLLIFIVLLNWTCEDKEEIFEGALSFTARNLMPLDVGQTYNLWWIEDTTFTLISILNPDSDGNVSFEDNSIDQVELSASTALAVSIEDATVDPNQIGPIIIAGDWSGSEDSLGLGHTLALGNSFRITSGQYQIVSPSQANADDTLSGIWYYDTTFIDTLTLFLPELTDQWIYQSWLQVGDIFLNMGQFRFADDADDSDLFSGPIETFGFPGEDFVNNAPAGLTFPLDVRGQRVMISLQPILDVAPSRPFFLLPLSDNIPADPIRSPQLNFLFTDDMIFPNGTAQR